ncbi:hypothetical protein [Gordonia sp. NB41Y]|uniref:hypothetical protein n=1 Tax=Gordonia sp. NB41Y TaxID=875808 RepID=UPI0002BED84C|nr:hypothetical protein [Gordonia sp. NB41Y]EMP14485.1 hypothetical protein ISGA_5 [Gordonia sp. NB41Y]WLP92569.1 hypothetical protein Q9K23_10240 [Gordonia sp. NB41Y]
MRCEIMIDGPLPAGRESDLPGLSPGERDGHIVLTGEVVDEAQLFGHLARLDEMGLRALEVTTS